MIVVRTMASKMLKAKEVRKLYEELQEAIKTEEGRKELEDFDAWVESSVEINRPFLEIYAKKEKAANATTLTA